MSFVKITQKEFFDNLLEYIDNNNKATLKSLAKKIKIPLKDLKTLTESPKALREAISLRKRILEVQFWSIIPEKLLEKIEDDDTSAAALSSLTNTYYKLLASKASSLNIPITDSSVKLEDIEEATTLETAVNDVIPFKRVS